MARGFNDEVLKQQSLRAFIQYGGPRPGNPLKFAGVGSQYMFIDGVTNPVSGDASPIRVPHPRVRGAYKLVGRSLSAPDLPSASLTIHEKRRAIPRQFMNFECEFSFFEYAGMCADLSDPLAGWDDYILVYSGARPNSADLGARFQRDSDEALQTQLGLTLNSIYPVGRMAFGEQAAATISTPVRDVIYGNSLRCASCGPVNDGTRWIYAAADGGVAAKPILYYSTDGGTTFTASSITSGANSDVVGQVRIMGNIIFVIIPTVAATPSEIHWTTFNPITGVPVAAWTKVTTGLVTSKYAKDVFVVNNGEAYVAGVDGYIYKITDPSAGVSVALNLGGTADFLRIHGDGENILVAGGDSGMVYKSVNGGATWTRTTTDPGAANISAVLVLDEWRYWVGNVSGAVYYTLDGGETWTQHTGVAPSATVINDIVAPTDEVLHVAYHVSGPAGKLSTSWTGGATWTQRDPRLSGVPTMGGLLRLNFPNTANPAVDANNLVGAATNAGVTDGSVILGAAAVL